MMLSVYITDRADFVHLVQSGYWLCFCINFCQEIRGYQIPYKSDRAVKSDRSILVQVKTVGIEADDQLQRTTAIKNNGGSG